MADLNSFELARQAALNPQTSAADLQTIAGSYPVLWPDVARHPHAYQGLLDWLTQVGDDQVRAIVAARQGGAVTAVAAPAVAAVQPVQAVEAAPVQPVAVSAPRIDVTTPRPSAAASEARGSLPASDRGGRTGHERLMLGLIILLVVALIAVGLYIALTLKKKNPSGGATSSTTTPTTTQTTGTTPGTTGPTSQPPSTSATGTTGPLTRITVNGSFGGGTADLKAPQVAAVQAFANDLADGKIDSVAQNCWTYAATDLKARWSTNQARQQTLDALAGKPTAVKTDTVWGPTTGNSVLSFAASELNSTYACPSPLGFTTDQAALVVQRLVGRHDGKPVNKADTAAAYPLLTCENNTTDCAAAWTALGTKIPAANNVKTGIGPKQWTVLTASAGKPLTFLKPADLGLPDNAGLYVASTAAGARLIFGTVGTAHPLLAVFSK